jgi:hypothetical protein
MTTVDDTIISLLDRPIAFNPVFARIGGSAASGVMMSQAWYWTARTKDADGWFFKSMEEWTTETGLSRSEQETARKNLQARGLMDYEKRGMPARMYYRVNKSAVLDAIKALHQPVCRSPANSTAQANLRRGRAANMFAETSQTSLPESGKQDCRDSANMSAEVPQASLPESGNDKENTTEISTETYPEITTAHRKTCHAVGRLLLFRGYAGGRTQRGRRCPIPCLNQLRCLLPTPNRRNRLSKRSCNSAYREGRHSGSCNSGAQKRFITG